MTKPIVQFVDALVGARKTSRTIKFIVESPREDQFIIATPNTTLSDETTAKLKAKGLNVLQIDSRDGTNCLHTLQTAVQDKALKVIVVNVNVVLKLDRSFTANHHLIIDEVPDVYQSFTVDGAVISKQTVIECYNTKFSHESPEYQDVFINVAGVEFLSKWRKEKVFDVEGEDKSKSFPKLLETIYNSRYRVVVETEASDKFRDGDGMRLTFFTVLQPEVFTGFKSVTILGANFTSSLLFMVHEPHIDFVPHPVIKGFYSNHSHKAAQTEIYYFSKLNASKYRLDGEKIGFQAFFDAAGKAIEERFEGIPHIFTMNNAKMKKIGGQWVTPTYKWDAEGITGTRLSPDPRGVDKYKSIHMAVHMAALNWSNMDYRFFETFLHISADDATKAMGFERTYQFLGRTSLRDFDRKEGRLILIVLDKRTALGMQALIGCGSPKFIDLGFPELREERNTRDELRAVKVDAQFRRRERKRIEKRLEEDARTEQYEGFGARVWSNYQDKNPSYARYDFAGICALMEECSKVPEKFKQNFPQFREGNYADLTNHLPSGNIMSSKMLAFDVDDSHLSPEDLSKFLYRLQISHIIYHSFSNKGYPYQYHILVPLSRAVTEANYRHIFNVLTSQIKLFARKEREILKIETRYESMNKWIQAPRESKFGSDIFIAKSCFHNILTREYAFLDVVDYLKRREEMDIDALESDREYQEVGASDIDALSVVMECANEATPGNRDSAFGKAGSLLILRHNVPSHEAIAVLDEHRHLFGKKSDYGAAKRLVKSLEPVRRRQIPLS